jgi:hemerythrin-like domain-containing protein
VRRPAARARDVAGTSVASHDVRRRLPAARLPGRAGPREEDTTVPEKALRLLQQQHREVMKLFKEAESAKDTDSRREACEQIIQKLQMHTELEEKIFYPALAERGPAKAKEMVNEAYEEHHVVDLVLQELPDVDYDDERCHAKITVLKELVQHHVEEEEQELFKLAEKLGKEQLQQLGEEMREQIGNGAQG